MPDSLFVRIRRVISAHVEDIADGMERAGGASVMREAIREVGRVIDEVRVMQEEAATRRLQALRQQQMFREKLAELDQKARFAVAQRRDDLAEAALSRQIDYEAQADRLGAVQAEAADEANRLDACLTALVMRQSQMQEALAAFTSSQRNVLIGGDGPARPAMRAERRVERAEEVFDRAMAAAGGITGTGRADVQSISGGAEIATLQKSVAVAQRMAALRIASNETAGR